MSKPPIRITLKRVLFFMLCFIPFLLELALKQNPYGRGVSDPDLVIFYFFLAALILALPIIIIVVCVVWFIRALIKGEIVWDLSIALAILLFSVFRWLYLFRDNFGLH